MAHDCSAMCVCLAACTMHTDAIYNCISQTCGMRSNYARIAIVIQWKSYWVLMCTKPIFASWPKRKYCVFGRQKKKYIDNFHLIHISPVNSSRFGTVDLFFSRETIPKNMNSVLNFFFCLLRNFLLFFAGCDSVFMHASEHFQVMRTRKNNRRWQSAHTPSTVIIRSVASECVNTGHIAQLKEIYLLYTLCEHNSILTIFFSFFRIGSDAITCDFFFHSCASNFTILNRV